MTLPLIGVGISYVVVAVLLLSLNLASRWHWGIKASAIAVTTVFFGVSSGFAVDSLQEGDGFEPSVPGTKEPVFVAEGEFRGTERGQPKRVVSYAGPMVRIHLPPAESQANSRFFAAHLALDRGQSSV